MNSPNTAYTRNKLLNSSTSFIVYSTNTPDIIEKSFKNQIAFSLHIYNLLDTAEIKHNFKNYAPDTNSVFVEKRLTNLLFKASITYVNGDIQTNIIQSFEKANDPVSQTVNILNPLNCQTKHEISIISEKLFMFFKKYFLEYGFNLTGLKVDYGFFYDKDSKTQIKIWNFFTYQNFIVDNSSSIIFREFFNEKFLN